MVIRPNREKYLTFAKVFWVQSLRKWNSFQTPFFIFLLWLTTRFKKGFMYLKSQITGNVFSFLRKLSKREEHPRVFGQFTVGQAEAVEPAIISVCKIYTVPLLFPTYRKDNVEIFHKNIFKHEFLGRETNSSESKSGKQSIHFSLLWAYSCERWLSVVSTSCFIVAWHFEQSNETCFFVFELHEFSISPFGWGVYNLQFILVSSLKN